MSRLSRMPSPQRVAALRWLRTASGPQLKMAAIQRPYVLSPGLPTT